MARLGSTPAAVYAGDTFVSLYLGATRVPTVPSAPTWDGTPPASGGEQFEHPFLAPANDGGSEITGYNLYINGFFAGSGLATNADYLFDAPGTYEIAVAAVNAVGEGPRLTAIYEWVVEEE